MERHGLAGHGAVADYYTVNGFVSSTISLQQHTCIGHHMQIVCYTSGAICSWGGGGGWVDMRYLSLSIWNLVLFSAPGKEGVVGQAELDLLYPFL